MFLLLLLVFFVDAATFLLLLFLLLFCFYFCFCFTWWKSSLMCGATPVGVRGGGGGDAATAVSPDAAAAAMVALLAFSSSLGVVSEWGSETGPPTEARCLGGCFPLALPGERARAKEGIFSLKEESLRLERRSSAYRKKTHYSRSNNNISIKNKQGQCKSKRLFL